MNVKIIGKCGICGGRVTVPVVWWSVVPPVPTCESCGAVVDDTAHLPTLPMRRRPLSRPRLQKRQFTVSHGGTRFTNSADTVAHRHTAINWN